jgi:serine/threonine protein kinase
LLGKGGFAEVFLGTEKESGIDYAIKELIMNTKDKSAKKYHSTFKEFSHEIEIQGALNHPTILKMIGMAALVIFYILAY